MKNIPMEEGTKPPDHVELIRNQPPMLGDDTKSQTHSRPRMTPNNQGTQPRLPQMKRNHKHNTPNHNTRLTQKHKTTRGTATSRHKELGSTCREECHHMLSLTIRNILELSLDIYDTHAKPSQSLRKSREFSLSGYQIFPYLFSICTCTPSHEMGYHIYISSIIKMSYYYPTRL